MSEFPEWIEERIGATYDRASFEERMELHRKIAAVYELVPDIEERLSRPKPCWPRIPLDKNWPWWKRYMWYMAQ